MCVDTIRLNHFEKSTCSKTRVSGIKGESLLVSSSTERLFFRRRSELYRGTAGSWLRRAIPHKVVQVSSKEKCFGGYNFIPWQMLSSLSSYDTCGERRSYSPCYFHRVHPWSCTRAIHLASETFENCAFWHGKTTSEETFKCVIMTYVP